MHSFKHKDTIIHHNGDFSGDAIVCTPEGELTVPCEALTALAFERARREIIAAVEQAAHTKAKETA
jgi:hypothetical protein